MYLCLFLFLFLSQEDSSKREKIWEEGKEEEKMRIIKKVLRFIRFIRSTPCEDNEYSKSLTFGPN